MIASLFFYLFAGIMLIGGVAVIVSKNPVHSVLFLILCFFNASGLFVLIGAEFVAFVLAVVYVGAVAVLFLFVVMMLETGDSGIRGNFVKYVPFCLVVIGVLLGEFVLTALWFGSNNPDSALFASPVPDDRSNTHAIGDILYTDYIYGFQIAGLVLLVAMMGAIVLTQRSRGKIRKQNVFEQINTKAEDVVVMVKNSTGVSILNEDDSRKTDEDEKEIK